MEDDLTYARPGAATSGSEQAPLDAPRSGDDAVDAAVSTLASVASLPVRDHVRLFDAVHGALSDRLAESRE